MMGRVLKFTLCVAAASALRPQRLQTPQREPSATQWANAAPQTLEVVAKQCLKTACACMAAANIIALPSAALATPASDGRALVEETVDLLDKYYFDGAARRRPEWLVAREKFGAAAEKNPGGAVRIRGEALKALGADKYTRLLDPAGYAAVARFDILGVGLILSPGADGRAKVVSPPLPGRSSYTLPDDETLPEPFTKEASPPQTAPKKPYRRPFSPAPAPAAPIDGPAKNSPSNSDNSWDDSESDDGDIAEAPRPAPSSDDEGIHIPTLGEASPARPARTRRTLADSHDSASVDDIPEIDTLDAVSASPQYSSRLGRQASVVEGDDGDSFEESD